MALRRESDMLGMRCLPRLPPAFYSRSRQTPKPSNHSARIFNLVSRAKGPAGRFPPLNAHGWTIAKASKRKEAAWEFLKWSASPEVHLKAALTGTHVSVMRNSVWKEPEFLKKYNFGGGKYLALFAETLKIGSPLYRPPVPEWPQMGERFSISVNEALTKQKPSAQAMRELQGDLLKLFKDAGYYKA